MMNPRDPESHNGAYVPPIQAWHLCLPAPSHVSHTEE